MPNVGAPLVIQQVTAPTSPPSGYSTLYPDTTGAPLLKNSSGSVRRIITDTEVPDQSAVYAPSARWPRPLAPSSILTTFQTGHGWTSSGTGSTFNLNDTTDFDSGTQSAKLTTGANGSQSNIRKFGGSIPDTTGKSLRLHIKIDNSTHLNELIFYLGSGSLANDYKWSIYVQGGSRYFPDGEWCTITLSFADAILEGTPARSGNTDMQFQVWDDAAGSVTAHIQSVELVPNGSATWPNGVVSICFDDVWDAPKLIGTTTAWSKLDQLGWPASLYVITDLLGTASHLTLDDLKGRHDRWGWEVAAHAFTDSAHALTYTGETAAALDADRRAQKAWLLSNGFRDADGSAFPSGQWGRTTDAANTRDYSRRYFAYERTTASRVMETWPPSDPMRLRAFSGITTAAGGVTPSSLTTATTGKIARAKADAGWLILVFHKIVTGTPASTSECKDTDFIAIMNAISTAGMSVATVGDVLRSTVA